MKLSSPGEMDGSPEESAGKQSESVGKLSTGTVSVMGDEMDPTAAIELLGEMLERPEAFGMVAESSHVELVERVGALEAENEELRESLRQVYTIMDEAESVSQFSLNGSVYDPTEEFE